MKQQQGTKIYKGYLMPKLKNVKLNILRNLNRNIYPMSFVSKLFPLCSVDYPEKLIQERPLNVLKRYFSMLSSPQNKFGSALLFWNRGRNITKRYL